MSRSDVPRGNSARRYWPFAVAASLAAILVFVGTASAASAPSIESESVSHITATDATLEAQINPNGAESSYRFEIAKSPACLPVPAPYMPCAHVEAGNLPSGSIPSGSKGQPVSLDLASAGVSLEPGATYHYRVVATNSSGETEGQALTFTTTSKPVIESELVSHITATDATLEAEINPGGLETEYEFWLMFANCQNPSTGTGVCDSISVQRVDAGKISAGSSGEAVSTTLTHLQPGYSYAYWVVATNSAGEVVGEDRGFTTQSADPPSIESESVSHVTATDATLEATINTEGLETTYDFLLQPPEPACLEADPPCMIPQHEPIRLEGGHLLGSFVGQSVSVELNSAGVSLAPGATYKYWVSATNAAGTTVGQPHSFTAASEGEIEPLKQPSTTTDSASSATVPSSGLHSATRHSRHHHRHPRSRARANHRRHRLRSGLRPARSTG
ncbi:MAG TPA: hypothetical protein VND98_08155 [Solirubrobacterales bacterium]|nr:hypothetical protein [Solirubrobacterales bacterium]